MEEDLAAEPRAKHPILGIASLAVASLIGVVYGLMITALAVFMTSSGVMGSSAGVSSMPRFLELSVVLGICIFASPLAALAGLVLGIASFLQRSANRLFAILGTSVSAVMFFTTCMVVVLAMLASR